MTTGSGVDFVARLKPYSLGAAILVAGVFLGACNTSASSHPGPQANVTHTVASVNAVGNNESVRDPLVQQGKRPRVFELRSPDWRD